MARRTSKPPPPLSEAYLESAGTWYVQNYGGNSRALRKALWRRVDKAKEHHPTDRSQAAHWIDAVVERFQRAGLVDDNSWARSKAKSLFAKGKPPFRIRQELRQKGISAEIAEQAVADLMEAQEVDPRLLAAATYARRRSLGPYRAAHKRGDRRDRDIAAMARAGFRYHVAKQVIDAEDIETLQELLDPEASP